jgi:hypothetical protein
MIFATTVGEIQAAHKAGLQLVEDNGHGGWMGTNEQWREYTKLIYN